MQKIKDGWWRLLLKDTVTNLYARIDFVKRTDSSLEININMQELGVTIRISFHEGRVTVAMVKHDGDERVIVSEEVMKFDGKFIWKEEDSSN